MTLRWKRQIADVRLGLNGDCFYEYGSESDIRYCWTQYRRRPYDELASRTWAFHDFPLERCA